MMNMSSKNKTGTDTTAHAPRTDEKLSVGAGINKPPPAKEFTVGAHVEDWGNWNQTIETCLVFVTGILMGIVIGKTWF